MGRNKCKPRIIPEQDKRICGGICLCQLTVVLSCVALVYLTVAIYMPSHRAFNSGFDSTPVMCQTINTTMPNNCAWASCGEWCLTKTSGFCPQIHVLVRFNGTDVAFSNCSFIRPFACPPATVEGLRKYNCNNGSECSALTGLFNCSLGHCTNMSEIFLCHYKADGVQIDSDKDNMKLNGFFECHESRCTKIKHHFSCDRYCQRITTEGANVYVDYEDIVYTAKCSNAITVRDEIGTSQGGVTIWRAVPGQVLSVSCRTITESSDSFKGTDCINGTVLRDSDIPKPFMNFTVYWDIIRQSNALMDPSKTYLPPLESLIIYDNVRLYINLEGCVNTLQGECKQFLGTHGRDGRNKTAQSRFTCFHNKNHSESVVARFDLVKTWRELIIAIVVPSVLFAISFVTLCIITQSVKVGDDTKMRCKCCMGGNDNTQTPADNEDSKETQNSANVPCDEDPIQQQPTAISEP